MRHLLLPLSSVALLAMACAGSEPETTATISEALPSADLSTLAVDFGELDFGDSASRQITLRNGGDLPMGLGDIALMADGMEHNFSVSWNADAISCPDVEDEDEAAAKGLETDTWDGGDGGGGDDGGGDDGGGDDGSGDGGGDGGSGGGGGGSGGGASQDNTVIMDPGCELPLNINFAPVDLGTMHAAIEINTVAHTPAKEDADPNYYRDPDQFHRVVMLQGSAVQGVGNIVVRSPNVDMGHHYTGEESLEYVYIHNVGDGDLTFQEPSLCRAVDCTTYEGAHDCVECTEDQDPCDDAFTIDIDQLESTGVLPGGTASFFQVNFNPEDLDPAFCELTVASDDGDTPSVVVKVKGNAGSDPENEPPTVQVISPPVGYVHRTAEPLELEIDMFDVNQPADTLICKVRSLLGETKIADCAADDESGRVHVEIPIDLLETGTDTLLVNVTDQAENRVSASTTILWKAGYPPGDDDGDGWGDDPDGEHVDCDDNDPTVYPSAAELPDGKDNDCDNAIDERTVAGDDDGDSVTELEGDCDDNDPTTYPGAIERPDQKDNNCDGEVDEFTSVHDDDGDGFAELDLDCDDNDPAINPSAVELCDDIDNNCDGFVDEAGCINITFEPIIVGGIQMGATAIGVGQSTTVTAFVYDADGQDISYQWDEDSSLQSSGHTAISDPQAQTITWTAPNKLPGDAEGAIYRIGVIIADEDGQQAWTFADITVYAEPVATNIERADLSAAAETGCGSSEAATDTAAAAALALPLLGVFAAARRRREDD
jgi:MYXO-CTERM domain-containing protein